MKISAQLKRFGVNVRNERLRQELSQAELAFRAGLDMAHIGRIENAQKDIQLSTVCKLSKALKLHPAALFDGL